jgi:hypothetical protein
VADIRRAYLPPFGHLDYCFTVSPLEAIRAVKYVFDTCSGRDFDTKIEQSGPQRVAGSNNNGCGLNSRQSRIAIQPTVAGFYRVRVSGLQGAAGNMTLRFIKLPPPIQTSRE